jgi:hypothetical protein
VRAALARRRLRSGRGADRRHVVHVPKQALVHKDTKTHAKRRVAVGASTVELLRTRRIAQAKDALACGATLAADAYVFSHVPDGSAPIDPDGISHRFLRLARRLGVNCRLHDLRHFMVTQLVAGGVDRRTVSGRAQHILAVIVGLITGVLLMESYGAMVTAARAGGRAIPELWPLGTEALALAMEVSVLEAKRLGHRAVLRLSWLLLVASVALSTLLQVAVAPPTLVGYLTAGATPVWLLGSFAVLSLLYRAEVSADPAAVSAEEPRASAEAQRSGAEVLTKRAQAERVYAQLSADGAPVSAGQLAAAAGLSASYARALVAQFHARPATALQGNGRRLVAADTDSDARP